MLLFLLAIRTKHKMLSNHLLPGEIFYSIFQKQLSEVIYKQIAVTNFVKVPGKHLCWRLFFDRTVGLRPLTLLRKTLTQVFSYATFCNFATFSRTPLLQGILSGCFCSLCLQQFFPRTYFENDGSVLLKNSCNISSNGQIILCS